MIFRNYDPKVMARLTKSAPSYHCEPDDISPLLSLRVPFPPCHCEASSSFVIASPDLSGRSNLVGPSPLVVARHDSAEAISVGGGGGDEPP